MKTNTTLWLAAVLIAGFTAITRGDVLSIKIDSVGTNLVFSYPGGHRVTQEIVDKSLAEAARSLKTPVWLTFSERVTLRELLHFVDHVTAFVIFPPDVSVEVIRDGKISTRSLVIK